jgi:hypothetical protein
MSFSTTTLSTAPRVRVLGWLAAAGTLPYLALKLTWLTGGTTGFADPAILADPAAFCAHALRRWSGVVGAVEPPAAGLMPFLQVVTAGGCVMAAASALLHLVVGLTAGSAVALGVEAVNAALAIAGAAGVIALVRPRRVPRWAAVAAAWTGSAAMFSWGLYTVTIRMTTAVFGGGLDAAGGGGFALAVPGMLTLVGAGENRRG